MRRPAQHHPSTAVRTAWAHPYTGMSALGVFHADGGDPAQPPTPEPPKPGPPPTTPPAAGFSQEDLDRIATKEKAQGERAGARKALEDFAAEHGFTNVDDAKTFIAAARSAEEAKKTDDQKRAEELARREQELADRETAAVARERAAARREVLAGLGATGDNLNDAARLLDVTDDADEQAVTEAAAKLKERLPVLFGDKSPVPPSQLPPAPGGAPAGGATPRPPASKDDAKDRARKLAVKMGYARDDAA